MRLALAGDTMLGRGLASRLATEPSERLFAPEVAEAAREADLFVLNLECCISDRGSPWPAPGKPFFFRAPPAAARVLAELGVDCVTLANNHALDFGEEALLDTVRHLADAGIACVGAGPDLEAARAPAFLAAGGLTVGVIGMTDHPRDFAAGPGRPGVAHVDLHAGIPGWLTGAVGSVEADAVLVSPHWGANMAAEPTSEIREAARDLVSAGATLVAGHSAHVFHGVEGRILYDLGDFLDDYRVDPVLRNDLGLLFLVTLDGAGPLAPLAPRRLEALPLKLEVCYTRPADGPDAEWISRRFREACARFGTDVRQENGRLLVDLI